MSRVHPDAPHHLQAKDVLPRKYRKNITALYIVEPTLMLKTTLGLITPFLSRKVPTGQPPLTSRRLH